MALSEARKRANKKWNDKNLKERYDRIQLVVPVGEKEIIQNYAKENGETLNGFVYRLIKNELSLHDVMLNNEMIEERLKSCSSDNSSFLDNEKNGG